MTDTPVPAVYRLRSITPRDRADLTRFYAGLSPDSRAARFHGAAPTIPEAAARFFCGPDHQHREGIVAECFDPNGAPVLIGHVCIEPNDNETAEMAIAVADGWQHRGVGREMLAFAINWAQAHRVARLIASTQCGNAAIIALLRSTGYPITFDASDGGTVEAYLDVRSSRPTAA